MAGRGHMPLDTSRRGFHEKMCQLVWNIAEQVVGLNVTALYLGNDERHNLELIGCNLSRIRNYRLKLNR